MSLYTAGMQLSALSPLDSISRRGRRAHKKSVSLIRRRSARETARSNSNARAPRREFSANFSRGCRADSIFAAAGKFSSPLVARSAARPAVSVILPAATRPSPPAAPLVPSTRPKLVPLPFPRRTSPTTHARVVPAVPPPPPRRRYRPLEPAELTIPSQPPQPPTRTTTPLPSTAPLCEPLVNLLAPL